jgi:hypothetical protein
VFRLGPTGLLYVPKASAPRPRDCPGGTEWRAYDALGLPFPSPELVNSAASLFEQAPPWAAAGARTGTEPESGRFRVTVARGVVRLAWTNPVRREKATQRAVEHHKADVDDWQIRIKDLLAAACRLDAPAVVAVAQCKLGRIAPGRSGRRVTQWSRKSRTAMCRTFAELDYTPLVDNDRVPAMITLTYPGDWEAVAPDGASVKRHMVLWRKRFHREYGESARYIWKLEFQPRGAPHVHLWMAPPTRRGRSGQPFQDWLSHAWTNVVAHPDPSERARHLHAGTAVDVLNAGYGPATPSGWRFISPSTHHQTLSETRNTSTSFPNCGANPAKDRAGSGACSASNTRQQPSKSKRTHT